MKGLISWFAHNGVVANLLMLVVVVGGLLTLPQLKKEVFPENSLDMITVSVQYRGAAPEEVEEGVCVRVEEAVQDLDGIKKISSTANEGTGTINIEVETGYDTREVLDDVKARVDAIDTFPEQTEKPVVQEVTNRFQVINVSISGDTDERTLKQLGERVRDELLLLSGITQVDLKNARPYEISIEVSEDVMRRHGLTFDDVARAVRRSSLDLPGGAVKADTGEVLLRTKGQAYRGPEFERLTLLTRPDGTKLRLSDVARVVDGFEETDQWARLDGEPAVLVQVYRVGDQNALDVAAAVHDYVEQARRWLPPGISITTWADQSRILRSRMDLLIRNALSGLALVFLVLALFLRLRLAFWVAIGIPVSFLGAIAMMPVLDISVNMISLFSFILVLGIVVDDAIVVGENIFSRQKETKQGLEAAVSGAKEVAVPVIFGVLTTVAAFAPMMFLPGVMGKIWRVIPCIVIPVLLFSLVESQWILPHHISHYHPEKKGRRNILARIWDGFFSLFSDGLEWFVTKIYRPGVHFALEWRYLTVAAALAIMLLTVGMVGGGFIKFIFFPHVESDNAVADLTMPQETPAAVTSEAVRRIEQAVFAVEREFREKTGQSVFRHVLTSVGDQPFRVMAQRFNGGNSNYSQAYMGEVNVELTPSEERTVTSSEIVNRWRELTGQIPDALELTFTSDLMGGGKAIDIQLAGSNVASLREVSEGIKEKLSKYPGVIDITDSFRGGKPEIRLAIKPAAEALGLTLEDMGRQVRQGFFGEEAQRIQRGRDDVRVMVRYPLEQRRSVGDLENMRIRAPEGGQVPFATVAHAEYGRGFATINRVNRQRTINVQGDVDESVANANEILADMKANFLPQLMARYPGVRYTFEGEQQDQMESVQGLLTGFGMALFAIYAMMAIPLRSYLQPLVIMSAIPFGMVGAVWGHFLMGIDVSLMSMCGLVALAGIVVNDSIVLVDFINTHRAEGMSRQVAVREAGVVRFRAILLTSLTTAAGITPLMLEKSVQAQFMIPMAVSLAFGVLFATAITLGLVPALYLIQDDLIRAFRWAWGAPQAALEGAHAPGEAYQAGHAGVGSNGATIKTVSGSVLGLAVSDGTNGKTVHQVRREEEVDVE